MRIRTIFLVIVTLSAAGCTITTGALKGEKYDTSRNYAASFDQTWEAVGDVMKRYPVTTIEKASGLLITDWIDGTFDVGQRRMLKDKTRLNIKVSALSNGGSRVTVNQYVKINAPASNVRVPGSPKTPYEWQDVSGIKDLHTVTSSKREREILYAIEAKLKQRPENQVRRAFPFVRFLR